MHHIRSTARAGVALATAIALALPAQASAQLQLTGTLDQQGGGLGNQLTVLTLRSPGNSSDETGCVTPAGPGTVATCGFANSDVQNQSQVQFLSNTALAGLTGQNLRVVGNFSEPQSAGNENVLLNDLRVILYQGTGAAFTSLFTSQRLAGAPLNLTDGPGIGNFGFVFGLGAADASLFSAALVGQNLATLSVGLGASVSAATGGLETFSIARGPGGGGGGGGGSVVPEPSTYVLLASGLLGLAGVARRRQRQS